MAKKTLTWKKLYLGRTSGTGEGLFAKVNFKKGNLIFTWEVVLKKGRYPCYVGDRWLQIEKCQWIAPLRNNLGLYINHSCNPNSGIINSVKIVAMKNIRRGEEVISTQNIDGLALYGVKPMLVLRMALDQMKMI